MVEIQASPGPDAAHAFRLGVKAGAIVGLVGIGLLYWSGVLPPFLAGYVLLAIFPVYLVIVATVLSVWLGYDKDTTSLRPVYRAKERAKESE